MWGLNKVSYIHAFVEEGTGRLFIAKPHGSWHTTQITAANEAVGDSVTSFP